MVTVGTGTIELVNGFVDKVRPASATVLASVALTANQLHRTVFTTVFRLASAKIVGSAIGAHSMLAGIVPFAFIDLVLTMISLEAFVAFACIAADTIHAGARAAGITIALIDVYLTIFAGDTLHAKALVPIEIL